MGCLPEMHDYYELAHVICACMSDLKSSYITDFDVEILFVCFVLFFNRIILHVKIFRHIIYVARALRYWCICEHI